MPTHLSWQNDRRYCRATNRDGTPCGNTVPKGFTTCSTHRKRNERDARAQREAHEYRRVQGHWPGEPGNA